MALAVTTALMDTPHPAASRPSTAPAPQPAQELLRRWKIGGEQLATSEGVLRPQTVDGRPSGVDARALLVCQQWRPEVRVQDRQRALRGPDGLKTISGPDLLSGPVGIGDVLLHSPLVVLHHPCELMLELPHRQLDVLSQLIAHAVTVAATTDKRPARGSPAERVSALADDVVRGLTKAPVGGRHAKRVGRGA